MNERKQKNKRILLVTLAAFMGLILIGAIVSTVTENENTNTDNNAEQANAASVSEQNAEEFCQDAALLGEYLDLDRISVIDVTNYNNNYIEVDATEQDEPIMQLTWNGKQDGDTVGFTCWVSGTSNDITLHKLKMNGETLFETKS